MRKPILLFLVGALCISFSAYSQDQTNSQKLQQLPPGHQFRSAFEALPVQAKVKAENWLNGMGVIPEDDFNSLRIDNQGGIYYADVFPTTETNSDDQINDQKVIIDQKISLSDVFSLHSKPGATYKVHLDFDGMTISGRIWNSANGVSTYNARPYDSDGNEGSFSAAERSHIASVWQRVADDFAPFDIDVTTEAPSSYGPNVGHVLITKNSDANNTPMPASGGGGVAYVNIFGGSNTVYYSPALVYYNNSAREHGNANTASHEFGHNLGLSHHGGGGDGEYYRGHGSGFTSWAPLMGSCYTKNVTQWDNGSYANANNTGQDDINRIVNKLNYMSDDHGDNINNATLLIVESGGVVNALNEELNPLDTSSNNKGVVHSSSDIDFFSFTTSGGQTDLTITPSYAAYNDDTYRSSNLDIRAKLYNGSGSLINTFSDANDIKADVSISLSAGTYYLSIEGEGSSNYSDYASHGKYYISGTIVGGENNNPPVASFIESVSDRTVSFTDTSTDSDGSIASWSWDFGDGNTSSDQNPVHNYTSDDDFTVSLTVTDDDGATNLTSKTVTTCLDTDGDGVCDDNDNETNSPCPNYVDTNGVSTDSDGDGLLDCDDSEINSPCPTFVDANGVSLDSDSDGVLDCDDVCPGGDDTIDVDGDGIPDFCDTSTCLPDTRNFSSNTLSHSGSGSSNSSVTIPTDGKEIEFSVSGLNQRTGGKPANRFIDQVTITYLDEQGNTQNYGVFSAANTSAVNVSISEIVQSVTVNLADGYDGNTSTNISVTLSTVNFCIETVVCDDTDGDGVCDTDDQCPGFDDNLDTDGDGIPDGCDTCNDLIDTDGDGVSDCTDSEINSPCPINVDANGVSLDTDGDGVCDDNDVCPGSVDSVDSDGDGVPDGCDVCEGGDDSVDSDGDGIPDFCDTSNCAPDAVSFNPDALTHSGPGSNNVSVSIPTGGQDVSFTVSNIDQRTGGKPTRRYIEQVTVDYVDELGNPQNYGVFSGSNSVAVNISGIVQTVTVSLADGYDGDSSTALSVDLSIVDFCVESAAQSETGSVVMSGASSQLEDIQSIKVYPNPASGMINVSIVGYGDIETKAQLYNLYGQLIVNKKLNRSNSNRIELNDMADGLYLLIVKDESGNNLESKRILIKQ